MKTLILGGTRGIGRALAAHYLQLGHQVGVCGRDLGRLNGHPISVHPALVKFELDIADRAALQAAIDSFAPQGPDLLIVTAGWYFNTRHQVLDADMTLRMLRTNVDGLHHAFELVAPKMMARGSGQLVAVASVAGLLKAFPGASLYSATKRNVLALCETYRLALAPFGVAVTAIVPGYVDTERLRELNQGDASAKPYLMSEAGAVRQITDAISARRAVSVFPWQMRWLIRVLNWLPRWVIGLRP